MGKDHNLPMLKVTVEKPMHLFCVELYLIRGGDFQQDGKIVGGA